jgi:hypothetical protein
MLLSPKSSHITEQKHNNLKEGNHHVVTNNAHDKV